MQKFNHEGPFHVRIFPEKQAPTQKESVETVD